MMNRLLKALLTSLWFVVLCAPIMGIHINPDHSVTFRWQRLVGLSIGVFFPALALVLRPQGPRRKNLQPPETHDRILLPDLP